MPSQPRFRSRRTLAPQAPPAGLYASTYCPLKGAEICARLAAGESLRSICRDDPSMPTERTVWNWARAHPVFRDMKAHALGVARARALAAQAAADAARRAERAAGRKAAGRTGRPSGYSPEAVDEVLARVMNGEGIQAICAEARMPSVATVYNWLRRHPAFLARYRRAKAIAPEIMAQNACEHLPWIGERKSWPMLARTVRESDKRAARLALKRYAPRSGPEAVRVILEEADGSRRVVYDGAPGLTPSVAAAVRRRA